MGESQEGSETDSAGVTESMRIGTGIKIQKGLRRRRAPTPARVADTNTRTVEAEVATHLPPEMGDVRTQPKPPTDKPEKLNIPDTVQE